VIVGMNMSFLTYCALNMMPDWGDILGLPVDERIERLRDPETRRFMEERAASPDAGVFARLTGWDTYVIGDTLAYLPNTGNDEADAVIREHPYEALGVAFGVGLLIGVLVVRR